MRSKRKKPKSTIPDSVELDMSYEHDIKGSFDLKTYCVKAGKIINQRGNSIWN